MALTSRRTPPRDPTKFPATQLFLLALVRAAEPIAILSILPYAWKFVLHFGIGDPSNAPFYAGVLISSFSLAESLSGMFWGGLSDKLGRKPVLIMGCCGTIISLLVVGFSVNFRMALFARFLGGALNGNQGVIQSMVGELVTNPQHEPKAYAIMPFVWSIGGIVGPSVGGFFAEPAENFPNLVPRGGLFDRFPYLLPNVVCAALMAISIFAAYFCLEETHPDMQPWSTPQDLEETNARTPLIPAQASTTTPAVNLEQESSYGTFNPVDEEAVVEEWDVQPDGTTRTPSIRSASDDKVFTKRVIMLTVALGIFTYHSMTYDHLFPIFCQDGRVPGGEILQVLAKSMATQHGSLAGGLGLSIQQVGIIMSVNGIIALVVQAIIFPLMASWLGVWKTLIFTAIGHPIVYFIVPYLALLPDSKLLYVGIYACLTVRNLFSILAYPVLLILIKEASPSPSCFGRINGLAASTGAAARTIASPIAGFVYGLGVKIEFTALAWWVSALVALAGTIQAFFINRVSQGPQHRVRTVAPCHFMPDEQRKHRPSVVRIKVHDDSGYSSAADADERTPFASRMR
ncbi:related to MFS transporter [Lecanosticta acicola]|uniref:Related to MFS transporter n=1 Tax=Lecanosticta acicola TaxID=111012 RepID=A0AAI8YSJ3_9PEZI|nr:related to MFS transporter [Lecanosticta acicola]